MQRTQRHFVGEEAENRRDSSHEDARSPNHSDNGNEENKQKEAEKKKKRQIKPRFKFEPKHLKDSNKGLRLFYNSACKIKTEQNNGENRNEVDLLNQFLRLYKEWHFNLVPKFELNYFISKCHNFGRENTIRNYMKAMRSVHIGTNTWDAFEQDEDEEPVVPPTQNMTQTQPQNRFMPTQNMTQTQTQNQNRFMPSQPNTQVNNQINNQVNTQANNQSNNQARGGQFSNWKRNTKPQENKFLANQLRRKAELEHSAQRGTGSNFNSEVRRPADNRNAQVQEPQEDDWIDYNQMLEQQDLDNGAVEDPPMLDDELWKNINDDDDLDNAQALDEADLEYRIKKLKY